MNSGGFQFFDLILLGMIAVFLVLRLRSVLGRRDGTPTKPFDPFNRRETTEPPPPDNVVRLPGRGPATEPEPARVEEPTGPLTPAQEGMARIKAADGSFDGATFVQGARIAFDMILDAYTRSDAGALKGLLSPELFASFSGAINERLAANQTTENTLVGFKAAEIIAADLNDRMAEVTVRFVTEQVNVIRNADGAAIDGDPTKVNEVVDVWTFARDTGSRNPNWTLIGTAAPE